MITAMVRSKLLADSALTALVSTRIYVDELPIPATLPAITIHKPSEIPDKQVSKGIKARVQVSCWADPGSPKNPSTVEAMAAAVRNVLHVPLKNNRKVRWTVGSTSYDMITRTCTGGTRLINDPTGWYHIPVDFECEFTEV